MARTLFVAMPFRTKYDPVLAVVKQSAELLGLKVVQVGEEHFAGSIVSHIRASIDASDLMVALVTEENGNVYYEIGLAHCQRKPVVLLTGDAKSLKFDLRDHRAIVYDEKNPAGIRDELVRTFQAALEPPSDPASYLSSTLGREGTDSKAALQKAVLSVAREAELQEPVHVKQMQMLKSNELAIEVEDFLGVCVRAVIDINGIVRVLKRL
jgi:hypothetical protein